MGVHYRVGIELYEGMAWEHLMVHLTQSRENIHRIAITLQQKVLGRGDATAAGRQVDGSLTNDGSKTASLSDKELKE